MQVLEIPMEAALTPLRRSCLTILAWTFQRGLAPLFMPQAMADLLKLTLIEVVANLLLLNTPKDLRLNMRA